MNIQKNNHAAHTKIEIENVLPTEIEKRSFEIITEELEQEGIVLPEIQAPITKRCIHTSADFDYAKNLVYSEHAVEKALEAIRGGASIVTDTQMGRSGINKKRLAQYGGQVYCFMSDEDVAQAAKKNGTTRAVASMKKACELNEKLIFAIGNAPTALIHLYELIKDGRIRPELVIGVPVGFVNVVQSKELILTLEDTPYIVARGRKGGSNIAACICNALIYMRVREEEFMTLQQLRYITMVAEKGTISEAAKELFISQPSLTNAIRELEQEMQVTIFHRTNKGVTITAEGDEFLAYARQILDQVGLMQERYLNVNERNPRFSVSCQHYSFAVNAFVDVIRKFDARKYDFTLRETQTYEIIEDVAKLKSEIGILYTSSQNETIIMKLIRQNDLKFEELFVAKPHVFISSKHPLADKEALTLEDLEEYPYLSFEQGDYNSFYFSEEILSTLDRNKNIKVRDRATLFNLAVGLDGYTVSSGVISKELNGENIIGKPLLVDEYMRIGTIVRKDVALSGMERCIWKR